MSMFLIYPPDGCNVYDVLSLRGYVRCRGWKM